jgi:hypothetical protein
VSTAKAGNQPAIYYNLLYSLSTKEDTDVMYNTCKRNITDTIITTKCHVVSSK